MGFYAKWMESKMRRSAEPTKVRERVQEAVVSEAEWASIRLKIARKGYSAEEMLESFSELKGLR